MDRAYSKRELDMKFKTAEEKNDAWSATIMEKLEDLDKYKLTPTLDQAKITNGRVSSLEKWRTYITGAAAVVLVIIGFLGTWFKSYVEVLVDEQFSQYQIREYVNDE